MENKKQGAFACASDEGHQAGLTKREYFAAMAMQAMANNINLSYEAVAFESVKLTDALLKELDKPKSE